MPGGFPERCPDYVVEPDTYKTERCSVRIEHRSLGRHEPVVLFLQLLPLRVSLPLPTLKIALILSGLAARDTVCRVVARNRPEWALAGKMTTPRYTSISAIGNRVTAVTCRTIRGR
jgi:hypothetical protein